MCAVQEVSGHWASYRPWHRRESRKHYSRWLFVSHGLPAFAANTINLGADLGMMGSALSLVIGGPVLPYVVLFAMVLSSDGTIHSLYRLCALFEMADARAFGLCRRRFYPLIPLAGSAQRNLLPPNRSECKRVYRSPGDSGNHDQSLSLFLASLRGGRRGCDTQRACPAQASRGSARQLPHPARYLYRNGGFKWGRLLYRSHGRRDAACAWDSHDSDGGPSHTQALQPLAGRFAFLLFALGIVGTGLLAIPVLAEVRGLCRGRGISHARESGKPSAARRRFYIVLAVSLLSGMFLNLIHMNVIKALYWSSVLNGLLAAPVICLLMIMTPIIKVMGDFIISRKLWFMGWATALLMFAATAGLLLTL